jgi:hypothetical protein
MAGALFYCKQNIEVIRDLDFKELQYWYRWHEAIAKEKSKTVSEIE